jgi:signal transduction histidine kinase
MDRDDPSRLGADGLSAPRRLRLLHLEDSEVDHELMLAQLQRDGLDVQALRVESERDFAAALAAARWDLVISDYNLPGFSGMTALEQLKASGRDVPFILVSGEIGEDTAVECMRHGASDYLLKNNLARLVPAMLHAIEAAQAEAARRAADLELTQSKERLRELAQHLQTSVESERAAIAREIHDDVGGSLTALQFDLAWLARHTTNASVGERVQQALETVRHAIEASQRIMHNLRPAILEQGLVAALQWMASRFEKRTGIATTFRTSGEAMQLPALVPLVAYRFAQEALTNVSKHAQASKVGIDLSLAGGVLSLEVSDDGRGLGHDDLGKSRSFGLRGLHERASTVGGWVDIASDSHSGTTLILSIPIDDRSAATRAPQRDDRDTAQHDPSSWGDL